MIRKLPILPTLLVALAAAAMIALGFWQLDRREWKEALLARYAANSALPPMAFPRFPDEALLFRRVSAFCLDPVEIERRGAGSFGYRLIATCRTGGAEGPGLKVQIGTTRDPLKEVAWKGGAVSGYITHAPSGRSLIGSLFDRTPDSLMLVADTPAAGLSANPPPDPSSIPNNHLAYAVQWFLFAGLAVVIYILALRKRQG